MLLTDKIYVAGHRGMVGSAIVRALTHLGYKNLVLRNSREVDLRNQKDVSHFFNTEKPDYVFLAAAKVGGIYANNTFQADFIYDNIMIQSNVIHESYKSNVRKLLFLGSSCIYPKFAHQPISENSLLTGPLEPTNDAYAIAKIAGIKMCDSYRKQHGCNFISAMPSNLYGPNDNYDLLSSHVLPALLRKVIRAKRNGDSTVEVWGTGNVLREFLHVDDLASACIFLMQNYNDYGSVNVGSGSEISIRNLAELIKRTVGFEGDLVFNSSKPDGTPRKILDSSKLIHMGWVSSIKLEQGIASVYNEIRNLNWD
jgi:GDP-L-fucose synthase